MVWLKPFAEERVSCNCILTGLAAGAVAGASSIGGSFLGSYLSDKNNEESQERSQKYNLQNMVYEYMLNRKAFKEDSAVNYDYALKRDADQYELAKRYTENSAAWQKQGMINANVNPILAYGSLGNGVQYSAANMGSGGGEGVSADTPSAGSSSIQGKIDFLGGVSAAASIRNMMADTQTKEDLRPVLVSNAKSDGQLKESQENINQATAEKIRAEAKNIDANTARSEQETKKLEYENEALGFHDIELGKGKWKWTFPMSDVIRGIVKGYRWGSDAIRSKSNGNSAKTTDPDGNVIHEYSPIEVEGHSGKDTAPDFEKDRIDYFKNRSFKTGYGFWW